MLVIQMQTNMSYSFTNWRSYCLVLLTSNIVTFLTMTSDHRKRKIYNGALAPIGWRSYRPVLVTTCLMGAAIFSTIFGLSDSVFAQTGKLLFRDGTSLPGVLIRSDAEKMAWRSPLFLDEVEFSTNELHAIRFLPPAQNIDKTAHRFEFQNGDVIFGNLVGATEEVVLIESVRLGKLEIPRNQLASISRRENILFSGPKGLAGWVESVDATFGKNWTSNRMGSLSTSQKGAGIFYPLAIAADVEIELTLSARKNPQFIFALGENIEKSLHIKTIASDVVLANADDWVPLVEMKQNTRSLALRLVWSGATEQLVIYSAEGKKLAEMSGKGCSAMSGIKLVNTGNDLRLMKMTVRKGVASGFNSTTAQVILTNGTILKGSLASVPNENSQWTVSDNRTERFSTTDIGHIQFPKQNVTSAVDSHKLTRLLWNSGELLSGKLLSMGSDSVQLQSALFIKPISVVQSGLTDVSFGLTGKQAATSGREGIGTADRLFFHSSRLLGKLIFSSGDLSFRWQPFGSDRSYRLNPATSFRIVKGETAKISWNQNDFPHRIHFRTGDVLRCRVVSMDEKQLRCQLPFADDIAIASSEIKALVIGTRRRDRPFTNESQARALTVPRFQQDDPFTHILIAQNDDLLRGRLVKVSEDSVFFESRLNVAKIDRNRISTIIRVDGPKAADASSVMRPEKAHVQLVIRGGDHVIVRMNKFEKRMLTGDSPFFGKCSIPIDSVEQFIFGDAALKPKGSSEFAGWTIRDATEPRWGNVAQGSPPDVTKMIGKKLQNFELPALKGKTFRSEDHRGKVLVFVYWATWSNPCKRAIPAYVKAISSFSSEDVLLIGINREEAPKAVRDYLKEQKISGFRTLLDYQLLLFNRLQVTSLPTILIVGSEGAIESIQAGYSVDGAEATKKIVQQMLSGTWKRSGTTNLKHR